MPWPAATHRPGRGRRAWTGALFAGVVLAVGTGWAPTASAVPAERELVASDPAGQAALTRAPDAVRLTFDAVPDPIESHVEVLDDTGGTVGTGTLAVAGATLRQPVTIRTAGNFTVGYHVWFTDGSQATGSLRFSVGTNAPPPAASQLAQQAISTATQAGHHSVDPLSAVLLVIDGAVALGVLSLLILRPRPGAAAGGRPAPGPGADPPGAG